MALFDIIPDRFFGVLSSTNRKLYLQALFVIREQFKSTDLVIRRDDLLSSLTDAMANTLEEVDLSEELMEDGESEEGAGAFHNASMILRHLKDTGWVEEENGRNLERNITVPDYAIQVINLLYDLSTEKNTEYNSYVYTTYAALKNSAENPDYMYQALTSAYQNTEHLVDQLKILFNNIKRYETRALKEIGVNSLLAEYFDRYKEKVVDTIYYPLKTIDSVPRFKGSIIDILNGWMNDENSIDDIIKQGIARRMFTDELSGHEAVLDEINYILNTYETIEGMINAIDNKHSEYTRVAIDKIRYFLNTDMSAKGKLADLLAHCNDPEILQEMERNLQVNRNSYLDQQSYYQRIRHVRRGKGKPKAIESYSEDPSINESFLEEVRKQYTDKRIDAYVESCLQDTGEFHSSEARMDSDEDFILFLLGTLRGREKRASYTVEFKEGYVTCGKSELPDVIFRRKDKRHV